MKYNCGHHGCDICGARECAGTTLKKYCINEIDYFACDSCIKKAIRFAVSASEEFSTIIDSNKPCGNLTNKF